MRYATFVKNLSTEHLTAKKKKKRKNKEVELVSEEVKPGNLHHDWNHHHKVMHLTHQRLSLRRQVSVGMLQKLSGRDSMSKLVIGVDPTDRSHV